LVQVYSQIRLACAQTIRTRSSALDTKHD
jgi:hypothetical protein